MKKTDIIRMVWVSISQNRPFFIANIIAISVGILLVVVMLSVSLGVSQYAENLLKDETAALAVEISVNPLPYQTPPSLTMENLKEFHRNPNITSVVPLVQGIFAELSYGDNNKTTVSLWSTIGAEDPELKRLEWVQGNLQNVGQTQLHYIIIPEQIAQEMGIYPASKLLGKLINLNVTRVKENLRQPHIIPLTVTAIAKKTRFYRCYIPLPMIKEIWEWQNWKIPNLEISDGKLHEKAAADNIPFDSALIYVKSIDKVDEVRKLFKDKGYQTSSILDTIRRYREISFTVTLVLGIIGLISLFTGSVSIFNATYASVLRRIKEIGIYKTYGAAQPTILALLLTETSITGALAGIIGYIGGGSVCKLVESLFLGENSNLDITQTAKWLFLMAVALAVVVCILASIGPALKAARLNPVEAIRHE